MENKLVVIVKESNLEPTKAKYILEKFQDYFEIASDWEKKAKNLIVTNADQTTEMEMARTGRLFLREKRIAVEKARKEREAQEKKHAVERARVEARRIVAENEKKRAEIKAQKEKDNLAKLLKNQIICPNCGHKFQRKGI